MIFSFAITFLAVVAAASPANHLVARKCKTFTPTGSLFVKSSQTFRASRQLFCGSPGLAINSDFSPSSSSTCRSNDSCALGNDEIKVPVKPVLNISLANSGEEDDVYKLVADATSLDFKTEVNSTVDAGQYGFCCSEGSGIAITVSYYLNCTNGTLSSCDSDSPAEGTAIEACAPSRLNFNGERPLPQLLFSAENVTKEEAANSTSSPILNSSSHMGASHYTILTVVVLSGVFWMTI